MSASVPTPYHDTLGGEEWGVTVPKGARENQQQPECFICREMKRRKAAALQGKPTPPHEVPRPIRNPKTVKPSTTTLEARPLRCHGHYKARLAEKNWSRQVSSATVPPEMV